MTHANASYLQNMGVKFNSSLGAWYEPTKRQRLVIYQDAGQNYLKEYNITTDQSERTPHLDRTPSAIQHLFMSFLFHL